MALSGAFAAILPFGKLEIHKVFLRFPNVALRKNPSLTVLADLFRASLVLDKSFKAFYSAKGASRTS